MINTQSYMVGEQGVWLQQQQNSLQHTAEDVTEWDLALLNNAYSMRQWYQRQFGSDGRRDLAKEFHHPTVCYNSHELYRLYKNNGVARRVVEVLPKECWKVQPCVYEDEDPATQTPFEQAWDNLGRQLRGPDCYHQDEQGSAVWEALARLDVLAGIGRFGILFFGFDDTTTVEDLAKPVIGSLSGGPLGQRQLLYVRMFPESMVEIVRYDSNPGSRRYRQPEVYRVTMDEGEGLPSGVHDPLLGKWVDVHWTRVLHQADNLVSSEVYGTPRLEPVLPNVLDAYKLYGSSAEMYYKGAFPGISLETHPSLGTDVRVNTTRTKAQLRDYMEGLERYISTVGFQAKSLAPQVVDPTPQLMAQLQVICIEIGVPMRIFMVSERGDASSSQEATEWNERLKGRMHGYLTPRNICPFVDRLIQVGVLPRPAPRSATRRNPKAALNRGRTLPASMNTNGQQGVETEPLGNVRKTAQGYSVAWPELASQTDQQKAATALQRTQALVQYVSGNGELALTLTDFLTFVMGYTDEEAVRMVRNAQSNPARLTQGLIDIATTPKPVPGEVGQGKQGGKGAEPVSAQTDQSPIPSQRDTKRN